MDGAFEAYADALGGTAGGGVEDVAGNGVFAGHGGGGLDYVVRDGFEAGCGHEVEGRGAGCGAVGGWLRRRPISLNGETNIENQTAGDVET